MCWYKTSKSNKGILIYIYQQRRELSILPWSKHFVPVGLSASNWSIYKSTFDWSNNCQSKSITINVRQKTLFVVFKLIIINNEICFKTTFSTCKYLEFLRGFLFKLVIKKDTRTICFVWVRVFFSIPYCYVCS